MKYRIHRGMEVSEIGVGCYALSGAYGTKDPQAYRRMLKAAIHSGITFFDTADTYGDQAEELLGEAVLPYRHSVILATKIGMRGGKQPDLSRQGVFQACENSLRRLQSECIDLYQVHYDDPATQVGETVGALEDLVRAGKIRVYGIGHLPMERIRAYLAAGRVFSGQFELSAVARDTRSEVLPLLQAHQAGLIAFSVTGRGLLTGRFNSKPTFEPGDIRNLDPLFQWERYESALRTAAKFAEMGRAYGKSSVQVAIAWVLAQPGVLCALTGPSSIAHLEENLGGSGWQIVDEHMAELEDFFTAEDRQLRATQTVRVHAILNNPLPSETGPAVQNLIYAIETAILAEWVKQETVMPMFMKIFQIQKEPREASMQELEKARHELAGLINIPGSSQSEITLNG